MRKIYKEDYQDCLFRKIIKTSQTKSPLRHQRKRHLSTQLPDYGIQSCPSYLHKSQNQGYDIRRQVRIKVTYLITQLL